MVALGSALRSSSLVLQDHVVLGRQADAGPHDVFEHSPLLRQRVHHRCARRDLRNFVVGQFTGFIRGLIRAENDHGSVTYKGSLGEVAQDGSNWVEGMELVLHKGNWNKDTFSCVHKFLYGVALQ